LIAYTCATNAATSAAYTAGINSAIHDMINSATFAVYAAASRGTEIRRQAGSILQLLKAAPVNGLR
jgi:hypothetical protein